MLKVVCLRLSFWSSSLKSLKRLHTLFTLNAVLVCTKYTVNGRVYGPRVSVFVMTERMPHFFSSDLSECETHASARSSTYLCQAPSFEISHRKSDGRLGLLEKLLRCPFSCRRSDGGGA